MKISEAFRSETFAKKLPLHFPHRFFLPPNQSNHPVSTEKNTHTGFCFLTTTKKSPWFVFQATNQPSPHQQPTISGHICPFPQRPRLFPCGPLRFPVKFNMSRNFAATSWRNWTQKRGVLRVCFYCNISFRNMLCLSNEHTSPPQKKISPKDRVSKQHLGSLENFKSSSTWW